MKTIYLAGGCFWGMQRFLDSASGVISTEVGYANGKTKSPTYEQVKHEHTGHSETVKVTFDESILPLRKLIHRFLEVIDPFSVNKQGADEGEQYRTGIYYIDESDKDIAKEELQLVEKDKNKKCAVELLPLENFYPAEEYHQKYLVKNPNGYCHILAKF